MNRVLERLDIKKKGFQKEILKKSLHASFWTVFGHGSSQGMRFVGNLILTRLLIPADFGLMQLVFVFIQGISMFSDLGLTPNIIQHPKAEDPLFLRTSWSIQFIRGFIIEVILILLAVPIAILYKAPILSMLIPVAGLCSVIDGFASTNLTLSYRKMDLKKIYIVDLISQFIAMVGMITCAWYWRSVWVLLVGTLINSSIKTILSHIVFAGPSMHFCWDRKYVNEIVKFGRWIFVSSIAGFLLSRLDRVLLGLYLSINDLGLYGIAWGITMVFFDLVVTLSDRVLMPLYSHLWKESSHDLKSKVFKVRALLMMAGLFPLFLLNIWGQNVIDWLYPKNYHDAGWMLRVLAIGFCLKTITATIGPFLFAVGNSFRAMLVIMSGAFFLILSMVIGGHLFGSKGVIFAIPIAELLTYPILVLAIYRYGIWLPWLDFAAFCMTLIITFFGLEHLWLKFT